jgi:hypothetical protein
MLRSHMEWLFWMTLVVGQGRHQGGKGLHSPTFQLNLSRYGHTSRCPPV